MNSKQIRANNLNFYKINFFTKLLFVINYNLKKLSTINSISQDFKKINNKNLKK